MAENLTTHNELTDFLLTVPDGDPYVVMSVGIPGSGRTEVVDEMASRLDIRLVRPDEVRKERTPAGRLRFGTQSQVWGEVHSRIYHAIKNEGEPVIVDGTHVIGRRQITPERRARVPSRAELVEQYREYGARAVLAVVCHISLEEALEINRLKGDKALPEYSIERMAYLLNERPVRLEEGYDLVAARRSPAEPVVIERVSVV